MYQEFYGLNRAPFGTLPEPRALYWSDEHAEAFAMLHYALIARAPIALITGAAGTGKTTLLNRLQNELPDSVEAVRVPPALACRGEPLDWLLAALGEAAGDAGSAERFLRFRERVRSLASAGRRLLLMVDEAQALAPRTLEELRLLTGPDDAEASVQVLLSGQPALRERLAEPGAAALVQRIAADVHIRPLGAGETGEYIAWRLLAAGAERPIFTAAACGLVHEATGGLPRLINILADLVLASGFAASLPQADEALVRRVLDDAAERGTFAGFQRLTRTPVLVRQEG